MTDTKANEIIKQYEEDPTSIHITVVVGAHKYLEGLNDGRTGSKALDYAKELCLDLTIERELTHSPKTLLKMIEKEKRNVWNRKNSQLTGQNT